MGSRLTRRDFINGVALGAAGLSLSPIEALAKGLLPASALGPEYYPPGLTGLRGSHPGSFEVAHAIAREGRKYLTPKQQTGPTYDLVVVGGGISGLSAAKFFRDRQDREAKILVLDNHDDFGGHARRNEFNVDGKTLIGYGGSQTIANPSQYSKVAKRLLRDLAIEVDRFYDYYDFEYFSARGLGGGIFFDKKTFGVDKITPDAIPTFFGEMLPDDEMRAAVAEMPISEADQAEFVRLLAGGVDYLDDMSRRKKWQYLRSISYLEFLEQHAGAPESVREILRDTYLPIIAAGWEAERASLAAWSGFPGTRELNVYSEEEGDPYIHHFPDGNAGIARALVRDLVPDAVPGSTMEDLVTARIDYSLLDKADNEVGIRLSSTAVNVANTADGKYADVTYVNDDDVYRVRARHVVLACYNHIIPYICDELPEKQTEAIRSATKVPFVIGSFALRNWRAFAQSGYMGFYSPGAVNFKHMSLDFPVSMGDYKFSEGPDEPIILSGWHSPTARGLPIMDQWRAGRAQMLQTTFDDYEKDLVGHLDAMLGPHGFDAERDLAAITLNRWPHGYAYEFEGIGVPEEYDTNNGPHIAGRAQIGRVSIANSDSEARAYADAAIDAADRAVDEQLKL